MPALQATYALIGRSPRFGRIVGYVLAAASDLPALSSTWSNPALEATDALVSEEHGAIAAAHQQLIQVRRSLPAATGGRLLLARLAESSVAVRVVPLQYGSRLIQASRGPMNAASRWPRKPSIKAVP
jgi:hypothetical protein